MPTIRVPALGESINEAIVSRWLKTEGQAVALDEPIVELETDKVTVEVPSPAAGVLVHARASQGDTVKVGDEIGEVAAETSVPERPPGESAERARPAPVRQDVVTQPRPSSHEARPVPSSNSSEAAVSAREARGVAQRLPAAPDGVREERVPLTPIRKRIAERLLEAQRTAAILTTFNEVDMSAISRIRGLHKDAFLQQHGVKLGFMGFFVKACVVALEEFPMLNAEISGEDVVYKRYYDIGVAVGGAKGLVVPVVRDADRRSFAELEREIAALAERARANKLSLEQLSGGTFTISNGGVYGSMLSTPILNVPQTGILGLHKISDRPVVVNGKIEIRPMMFLALSYDHRLVDGRDAVQFLVRVKQSIEEPERLLLRL